MEQRHVAELAANKFKEGYNCAESVLRALNEELKLNLSDDALKMATGFGGGLGQAGCMCGALAGAVMALNVLQGRTSPAQSRGPAYTAAKELHDIFTDTFGASCCRLLRASEFGTTETKRNCLKLTAKAADLAIEMVEKKGLI